jgi:hypothetical protein
MDSSQSPYYLLQFHQEANSPYLYDLEQDELVWFENKTMFYMSFGKQIDTINVIKSNYSCDEDNSKRFMQCMENYYSQKLGCMLPWVLKNNKRNDIMNLCKGKEKFKEYKNIAMNILKSEASKELINEGCLMPNCMQRSWTIKKDKTLLINKTGFQFQIPRNMKVLVREEVKLYTFINFFAEVGGYLGLLLGESLLSYLMTASKWFQSLKRKFKEHCEKAEDQGPESSLEEIP